MSDELYQPLIERDLDAIPAAAHAFAEKHSVDELYVAVARFAVLAYAPSMHSKRAVMACRAAHALREVCGERWIDLIIECARYTAESRQPWSEPPILEDLPIELPPREAMGDDALLMLDTAEALIPILGEKGKAALLRMPQQEVEAGEQTRSPEEPIETLVDRAIASRGAVEDVTKVFVCLAQAPHPAFGHPLPASGARGTRGALSSRALLPACGEKVPEGRMRGCPPLYHLARDFAQTLLAHAHAPNYRRDEFLAAVKDNLAHGEDFSAWSMA